MSYLVLARKWRPTTFEEVVGQGHVTQTLTNALTQQRVAHALLFTGSRGIGKTTCARILAKALNCDEGPTAEPCGVCTSCTDIAAGKSVDVFEIDGASNNSVEQIREIREAVKFVSTRGKRKIYIIDEVHMLSTAAFNALLKTLEEPPPHVLFIFATTEPHKIPETIVSRCQRFDFKRIPEQAIVDALSKIATAENIMVEPAALHHIARESKGGMRDSLSLLDQVIAFCGTTINEKDVRQILGIADRGILHGLTGAILGGDGQGALQIVDDLFRHGLDLQKFATEFVQHLRDLMVIKVCNHPERLVDIPEDELRTLSDQIGPVPPARIHRLFNALVQGAEEVSRSNFPKLVFEMTVLRLCEQGPTLPLAQVLDGLARLEARLDAPLPPEPAGGGGRGPAARSSGGAPSGGAPSSGHAPSLPHARAEHGHAPSQPQARAEHGHASSQPQARAEQARPHQPHAEQAPAPIARVEHLAVAAPEPPTRPLHTTTPARPQRAPIQTGDPGLDEAVSMLSMNRGVSVAVAAEVMPPPVEAPSPVAAPAPEQSVTQQAKPTPATPPEAEDDPDALPPHVSGFTRRADKLLASLEWPASAKKKSAFDAPAQAVRKLGSRAPRLRVVKDVPPPDEDDGPVDPIAFDDRAPHRIFGELCSRLEKWEASQLRVNARVEACTPERICVRIDDGDEALVARFRDALEAEMQRSFDAPPALDIAGLPHGQTECTAETVAEYEARLVREARARRERAARNHPAVLAAVEILGGAIERVVVP